jgi:hypothetical protein
LAPQHKLFAMSLFRAPEAASSTIFDRNTKRAGIERPRDQRSKVIRSLSDSLTGRAVRITHALCDELSQSFLKSLFVNHTSHDSQRLDRRRVGNLLGSTITLCKAAKLLLWKTV